MSLQPHLQCGCRVRRRTPFLYNDDFARDGARKLALHCHLHGNLPVWIVPDQFEVGSREAVNVFHIWVQTKHRKRPRCALQLLTQRLNMVVVDVRVPEGMNELSWLKATHLCDHKCEH